MRHRAVILVGLLTIFVLAGLARQSGSEPTTVVKVDGSSTVFPITEAVAEEFQK
ncbi:MAG TPA: protein sphX, partial [Terriglobia bacterium]|nr:protein sphX [Terriglobia bacterium]